MYINSKPNTIGKVADFHARADQHSRLIMHGHSSFELRHIALVTVIKGEMTPQRTAWMKEIIASAESE